MRFSEVWRPKELVFRSKIALKVFDRVAVEIIELYPLVARLFEGPGTRSPSTSMPRASFHVRHLPYARAYFGSPKRILTVFSRCVAGVSSRERPASKTQRQRHLDVPRVCMSLLHCLVQGNLYTIDPPTTNCFNLEGGCLGVQGACPLVSNRPQIISPL